MVSLAFTTSVPLSATPNFRGRSVSSRPSMRGNAVTTMSVADNFMFESQTREAKQAATPFGVYTVQCTEATGGENTAEATRIASLATSFRLRQTSASARYADLYATRRAAVIAAAGSHVNESYAVKFPARAAAGLLGRAEAMRACSRYFVQADPAEEYMFNCVDRQYKEMKVPYGTFNTTCSDGRIKGDAETARVAALATAYRAGTMDMKMKTQMRYNASLEAVHSGRGCSYEEEQYLKFPKMAGAIRWSTGAYAAMVSGVTQVIEGTGGALATVAEQVQGANLDAYWPSNKIRPAITRKRAPWESSGIKSYSYMSPAAVDYGIKAQTDPFEESPYQAWSSGWKPRSSVMP